MNTLIRTLIVTGVAAFIGALLSALFLRRKTVKPLTEPISSYITGSYGWLTSLGFAALMGSLLLLAHWAPGPLWTWHLPLWSAAVALMGVVGTKWAQLDSGSSTLYADFEDAHLLSAAIAFGALTFAELHSPLGLGFVWAPWAAIILAVGFTLLKSSQTTLLEWSYTALILTWFGCLLR